MQFKNYFLKKMPYLAMLIVVFGLSSCGSYQYVGVDNDGIYGTTVKHNTFEEAVVELPKNSNATYYENYFKNKSLETENMVSNSEIFTDIDTYQGTQDYNQEELDNTYQGYGGWGQTNSAVTINYIDNGFNNIGWNDPFINGWGWNRWNRWDNWGWNRWNNWGWNAGFYDPFWGNPYYGGGFYGGWAYNNGWGGWNQGFYGPTNRFYNNRISHSAGRRGAYYGNTSGNLNTRRSSNISGRVSPNTVNNARSKYNTTTRRSSSYSNPTGVNSARSYNTNGTRVYSNTQRRTTTAAPLSNSTTRSSSTTGTVRRSSGSSISRPYNSNGSSNQRTYSPSSSNQNSSYSPSRSSSSSSSGSTRSSSSGSSSRSSGSSSGGGRRGGN